MKFESNLDIIAGFSFLTFKFIGLHDVAFRRSRPASIKLGCICDLSFSHCPFYDPHYNIPAVMNSKTSVLSNLTRHINLKMQYIVGYISLGSPFRNLPVISGKLTVSIESAVKSFI